MAAARFNNIFIPGPIETQSPPCRSLSVHEQEAMKIIIIIDTDKQIIYGLFTVPFILLNYR